MNPMQHQYVERETGKICTEPLFADRAIQLLYSEAREKAPLLFRALTGARMSSLLSFLNYDMRLDHEPASSFLRFRADPAECVDPPHLLNTARRFFERKIRYWHCRPMPQHPAAVVSPADAKVVVGSLSECSSLFIKNKFFCLEELLGEGNQPWVDAFQGGDFAIFRLTPDEYHYNHVPVAGVVKDFYPVQGAYHSCNPFAVISLAEPYSKKQAGGHHYRHGCP